MAQAFGLALVLGTLLVGQFRAVPLSHLEATAVFSLVGNRSAGRR